MLKNAMLGLFFGLSFFLGGVNLQVLPICFFVWFFLCLFLFVCLFVCFCCFLLVHWFVRSFVCLFFEVLQGFVGCGVVVFGRDGIYLHMYFPKNP